MESNQHNFSRRVLLDVGSFFKNQRLLKNLTLEEVAQSAGLASPELLALYEDGSVPIPSYEIFKLSDAIGIPERIIANVLYDVYIESALLTSDEEDLPLYKEPRR